MELSEVRLYYYWPNWMGYGKWLPTAGNWLVLHLTRPLTHRFHYLLALILFDSIRMPMAAEELILTLDAVE